MNLRDYDQIILNLSGGKDSQAMLLIVAAVADVLDIKDRLTPIHIDTGNEWPESGPHCRRMTQALALDLTIVKPLRTMPQEITRRGRWPTAACRSCVAVCKRDPVDKFIRTQPDGRILNVTGERCNESKKRETLVECETETRLVTRKRQVTRWRPLLDYSIKDVLAIIAASTVPPNPVYSYGLSRVGCMFCPLARHKELRLAAEHHPKRASEMLAIEKQIGYRFTTKKTLASILLRDQSPSVVLGGNKISPPSQTTAGDCT